MKNILITGAGSYLGTSFAQYLAQWPEKYTVHTLDMQDPAWREHSFSGYDAIYHVAGIAHSEAGRISEERKRLYYAVNCDLAVETAQKAKREGVGQFIFMSSVIVYGLSAPIGQRKVITPDTPLDPFNVYGDSKVQAEKGLATLRGGGFKVVILRPPMVYGPGCRGNYPTLSRFARKLPLFPKVANQRSMLYVGSLMEFVRLMVENGEDGVFFPQNGEYTNTSEMVRLIAAAHGRRLLLVPGFTWALKLMSHVTGLVNKAFGSYCYEMSMSEYRENYRLLTLEESIKVTENHE